MFLLEFSQLFEWLLSATTSSSTYCSYWVCLSVYSRTVFFHSHCLESSGEHRSVEVLYEENSVVWCQQTGRRVPRWCRPFRVVSYNSCRQPAASQTVVWHLASTAQWQPTSPGQKHHILILSYSKNLHLRTEATLMKQYGLHILSLLWERPNSIWESKLPDVMSQDTCHLCSFMFCGLK